MHKGFSQNFADNFEAMQNAKQEEQVWEALTNYLGTIGISSFNYGYFDTLNHAPEEAPLTLKSTMDPTWIDYYFEKGYEFNDHINDEYRKGRVTPIFSGPELIEYVPDLTTEQKSVFGDAAQAGLKSGTSVPLPSPVHIHLPMSGICLVSNLPGHQFKSMFSENGLEIMIFLNHLHNRMAGPLLQRTEGINSLTGRENDCLVYLAQGLRPDRIADTLGIATVTVNVHLKNARNKLKAKTLPQTIAKAIRYGIIKP